MRITKSITSSLVGLDDKKNEEINVYIDEEDELSLTVHNKTSSWINVSHQEKSGDRTELTLYLETKVLMELFNSAELK